MKLNSPLPAELDPAVNFWRYFKVNWEASPYHFQRALHLHQEKIEEGIDPVNPAPGLKSYLCLLLGGGVLTSAGLGALAATPLEKNCEVLSTAGSIVEAIERKWRRDKSDDILKDGVARITSAMVGDIPLLVQLDLLHHRGKFHRWLQNWTEAQSDFEAVLAEEGERWPSHLQLARVFRQTKQPGAEKHLRIIFDAFSANEYTVPATVILAALSELGRKEHRALRDAVLRDRIDLIKRAVSISLVEGFSQPYQVLGRIGRYIFYTQPQVLIELVSGISFPTPDEASHDELFEIAECLKFVGKAHGQAGTGAPAMRRWCERALEYYQKAPSLDAFKRTMYAECCLLVKDYSQAETQLNQIPETGRSEHWWHRNAQTKRGLRDLESALRSISKALETLTEPVYRAAFLLERAEIEADQKNPECLETIHRALELTDELKFRQQLTVKLEEFSGRFNSKN